MFKRRQNVQQPRFSAKKKRTTKKVSRKTKSYNFKVNGVDTRIVSKQVSKYVTNFKVVPDGQNSLKFDFNVDLENKKLTLADGTNLGNIKFSKRANEMIGGNSKNFTVHIVKPVKEVTRHVKKSLRKTSPAGQRSRKTLQNENERLKYMAWCLITISICATLCFGLYYYSNIVQMNNIAAHQATIDFLMKHDAVHLQNLDKIALEQLETMKTGINGVVTIVKAFLPTATIVENLAGAVKGVFGK